MSAFDLLAPRLMLVPGTLDAMTYPHLGLRAWPFRIVPEPEFCDFLADRATLRGDVEELLISLENRPTSDIQLIWSWYGAGKTHTAFYLANMCSEKHGRLLPVYSELPRGAKTFQDLYRVAVSRFSVPLIIEAFLEFTTRPSVKASPLRHLDRDLNSALTQAAVGERAVQVLLGQWLLGNPLNRSALNQLGVGARVATTEQCAVVIADIISLLTGVFSEAASTSEGPMRVLWIIDEVQRVEEMSDAASRSILSGLVGVFNRCPTGLTILMAYTGEPSEKSLPKWIPPDLKDRIGLERPMLLPPLRTDEAKVFVSDLLAHFRLAGHSVPHDFFPFGEEAIDALIRALSKKGDLKPRSLMETLDASLRHLEPQIRDGILGSIDLPLLKDSLARFALDWSGPSASRHKKR